MHDRETVEHGLLGNFYRGRRQRFIANREDLVDELFGDGGGRHMGSPLPVGQ